MSISFLPPPVRGGEPETDVVRQSGVTHSTPERPRALDPAARDARLAELLRRHHATVWRMLRRLGIGSDWIEDVLQEVFVVASERLEDIEAGKERRFLLNTAVKKAANHRRKGSNRLEVREGAVVIEARDPQPDADQLLAQKRFREIFDDVLEGWPLEVRTVFVMFELEGLSVPEIAEIVEAKEGTVASRLRRGRELFLMASKRLRARGLVEGSGW